ncbi:hypothetical protein [Pseudomonas sp. SDO5271_S396]
MAALLFPFIPVVLAGLGIIGGSIAGREVRKNNAAEEKKAREELESRVSDLNAKIHEHSAKGEYAPAIKSFRELISLYKENYNLTPDAMAQLNKSLQNMIFESQEKAIEITHEFKKKWASLEKLNPLDARMTVRSFEAMQNNSKSLCMEHKLYIDKLKVVLPDDDAFLKKEMSTFDEGKPPFGGSSYKLCQS